MHTLAPHTPHPTSKFQRPHNPHNTSSLPGLDFYSPYSYSILVGCPIHIGKTKNQERKRQPLCCEALLGHSPSQPRSLHRRSQGIGSCSAVSSRPRTLVFRGRCGLVKAYAEGSVLVYVPPTWRPATPGRCGISANVRALSCGTTCCFIFTALLLFTAE